LRQIVFANNYYYHVFNRGIARQPIFITKKDYDRAVITLDYYRYKKPTLRLARALTLNKEEKGGFFNNLKKQPKLVEIISYCLMPNHFHFLLKQKIDKGIPKFLSNFSNSYTRYFNTRRKRIGPLFQGIFKAVRIEEEEQLVHVSRYIHLNPVASLVIINEELSNYPWSSLSEYLNSQIDSICDQETIFDFFPSRGAYREFVYNQIDYAKKLEEIKHLTLENH